MQESNGTLTCEDFTFAKWTLDDINDERLQVETFYASALGIAVSVTSSLVSTCASILVIYIIMRSAKHIKESVYHRILFGMSIFDILQSLAIAFVTLPMPKDMIYQQFQGLVLGNDLTCRLQGLLVALGSMTGIMYNLMLSIYYLCSIRYDMTDEDFSKRLEPWLHAMSVFYGTLVAFLLLWGDSMNPNPAQSNWCAANSYPYYCSSFVEGERYQVRIYTAICITAFSFLALIVLLSCMVLIVLKVRRQEKDSANDSDTDNDQGRHSSSTTTFPAVQRRVQEQLLNEKKSITKQAWAYTIINLFNYFMIIILPIVRNLHGNPVPPTWWQVTVLIMRPLQGLLNCIIFIYHKVDSLQRNDPALKLWAALRFVVRGEEGQVRIVSDLRIVRHHTALSQIDFADDVHVEDDIEDDYVTNSHSRSDNDDRVGSNMKDAEEDENEGEKQDDTLNRNGSAIKDISSDTRLDHDMAQVNRENQITSYVSSPSNEEVIEAEDGNNDGRQYRRRRLSPISATAMANINTRRVDEENISAGNEVK